MMKGRLANDLQGQTQCVTCTLEAELYGLMRMQVQAALREFEVTPVPLAPQDVGAIIDLHGPAGSVIDAQRQILGILADPDKPLTEAGLGKIASS